MTTNAKDDAPPTRRAHLAGPSRRLDPRVNAARPDLADIALAGIVAAPRFAEGVVMRNMVATTMLRARPDDDAVAVSALLFGEVFTVFDLGHGWAWGQCRHDGYVGWLRISALGPMAGVATHRVAGPTAAIFAAPDIKARVVGTLPLNARIAAGAMVGDLVAAAGGFIHKRHLVGIDDFKGDSVATALGFVGTPYVWGGRTREGIDCSGLTQAVLLAVGHACPRDSDQQAHAFSVIDPADRRRGDLVVFPGHVGILADADTLVHANAWWMATVVEPLADVAARLAPTGFHRPGAEITPRSSATCPEA